MPRHCSRGRVSAVCAPAGAGVGPQRPGPKRSGHGGAGASGLPLGPGAPARAAAAGVALARAPGAVAAGLAAGRGGAPGWRTRRSGRHPDQRQPPRTPRYRPGGSGPQRRPGPLRSLPGGAGRSGQPPLRLRLYQLLRLRSPLQHRHGPALRPGPHQPGRLPPLRRLPEGVPRPRQPPLPRRNDRLPRLRSPAGLVGAPGPGGQ